MTRPAPATYRLATALSLGATALGISLAACSSTPKEPPVPKPPPACVEGAIIKVDVCPDKRKRCEIKCDNGAATPCGPCGGDTTDADAGPTGEPVPVEPTAFNSCQANLTKNVTIPIKLGEVKAFKYNEDSSYKNSTTPTCIPSPGPDGVTVFTVQQDGKLRAKLISSVRGKGGTALAFRGACADKSLASNAKVCAACFKDDGPVCCVDGKQPECSTICETQNQWDCKANVKDGEYIDSPVSSGERIMVLWDQTDATDKGTGLVKIEVSLLPLTL
jgi:hypothetical protein